MSVTTKVAKVTCEIYKPLVSTLLAELSRMGLTDVHGHSRRALVLKEKTPLPFLPPTTGVDEDPVEVFDFHVDLSVAERVIKHVARACGLDSPGRGSIYAQDVELIHTEGLSFSNETIAALADIPEITLAKKLSCLSCVVQRGEGNGIAIHALESGTTVPSIGFGVGTGLRNKLGLLRVVVPAEKEVLSLIISEQDSDEIMNSLVAAGKLDQPGKGFISVSPVTMGIVNGMTFRGKQRHSATMDQIIGAIDRLERGTEWRKRSSGMESSGVYLPKKRLSNLVNMTILCNEGRSGELVNTAMGAGAGGATIGKLRFSGSNERVKGVSPARESIALGVAPAAVGPIVNAIAAIGAFDPDMACLVETRPMPSACTYLGK